MEIKEWSEKRYSLFNSKIDNFVEHEKYKWLRKYADDAIMFNDTCGYYQIKAEDFIKRIECATLEYIKEWLDGNNRLEWDGIKGGAL